MRYIRMEDEPSASHVAAWDADLAMEFAGIELVEKKYLPEERAEGCEDEFKQVQYAISTLFKPYIDRKRATGACGILARQAGG